MTSYVENDSSKLKPSKDLDSSIDLTGNSLSLSQRKIEFHSSLCMIHRIFCYDWWMLHVCLVCVELNFIEKNVFL
jgi:hypothetical protein